MPRSSLRQFSSAQRREGPPWTAVVGLLIAAVGVNGVGLYGTSSALARALEPVPQRDDEEIVEFDLVEPPGDDLRVANQTRIDDRRPDGVDSDVEHETQAPKQRSPRPNTGHGQARGDHEGAGPDESPGVGDDSLVDADDGVMPSEGADSSAHPGKPDPLANLSGSPSLLNDTFGPLGGDEVMRDVDEGSHSVLDSRRHVYGSFFSRMRDQVQEQWRPNKVHNAADPRHERYGEKQRTTVLMVRLDEKGEILKVVITRKSGAPHLDAEAVRAMKAAAPFLNPPEGLANASGYIDFDFGFTLDFVSGSRIFRYRN